MPKMSSGCRRCAQTTIAKHKLKCLARVRKALVVPPAEPLPEGATAQAQAEWHCERIKKRLEAAEKANPPSEKEIATLYGQYTNALRHHAKVSGALDITEAAIVRSAPFVKIRAVIDRALAAHPEAYKAVAEAIKGAVEGR